MKLAAGTVLDDRFQIVSFLGAGSFGEVYKATQLILGQRFREVALKLFTADRVTAANVDEIFSDAIVLIGLQEENPTFEVVRRLVQIYDIGFLKSPERRAFMSMKLVPGNRTLETEVRRFATIGGMPVALSLRYLRQLLIPLAWMHTLDSAIVHGDLKPDNVLLTEASDIVLTDFGLAARMPLSSLCGAIAYQAPEKLLGSDANSASDVYAVGLIWYEMLTGRHLFADVGLEATAAGDEATFIGAHREARKWPIRNKSVTDDPRRPQRLVPASEFNQELQEHPQLETMLAGCLTYEQSTRYPNAAVLLTQVEKYMKDGFVNMGELGPVIEATQADVAATAQPAEKSVEARLRDSETHLARKNTQQALAIVEAVLREQPGLLSAALLKVRSLAGLKRINEAKQVWAEARKSAPNDPAVYEAQAEIHEAEGKQGLADSARVSASRLRLGASGSARRGS
jgi:serine/threonine protein kinase